MFTSKSGRVIRGAAAAAVCLTLALGTAGVALAGPGSHSRGHSGISSHDSGHWNTVFGTISGLATNQITLKGRHGTTTDYTTVSGATGTTYFVGKSAGVVGDLATGEHVSLELTSTSPQTVTKVTISPEVFFGKVVSFASNVITITSFHNTTLTVNVDPTTTTYTSGGAASTSAAVVSGAEISAVGLPGTAAGSLNAISVNVWVPRLTTHVFGTISGLATNQITLKGRHGTTTDYTTVSGATGTTYFVGKSAGVVGDLATGEHVSLELTSTSPQTVTKVTISPEVFFGKVVSFASNVITITSFHNTTLTVNVDPTTTTYTSGGAASTSAAVVSGAEISAVGLPGTAAGSLNAISVNVWSSSSHVSGRHHGPIMVTPAIGKSHGKTFGHSRH